MVMSVKPNPKSQKEFGEKLRDIRERRNLSQEEIAKAIDISTTFYAGIERGEENPTFAVLENICNALKVKSSEILPF